ncbi:MAG: hypothetical protein KatS3mg131_3544 [Candidatus Tectimicrobiota bacterium]|nr:MAG: hypothetical protein KatS3mg131_3544 [Candidatus Tectomicrobia bacterium]
MPATASGWRRFSPCLPPAYRHAFEFRHPSWHNEAVYALLQAHNVAFCIFELAGFRTPLVCTADFAYVRLHGPGGAYQGCYDEATLGWWARTLQKWQEAGRDGYVFFDNDEAGYAVRNALTLQQLLR